MPELRIRGGARRASHTQTGLVHECVEELRRFVMFAHDSLPSFRHPLGVIENGWVNRTALMPMLTLMLVSSGGCSYIGFLHVPRYA